MGILKDRVNKVLESKRKKKWEILKECCEDDIKRMIDENVPIRIQLKVILESRILKKLTLSEYYKIIRLHFGYTGPRERVRVFEVSKKESVTKDVRRLNNVSMESNVSRRGSVKEALKKDINILKVAGIDIDEALKNINSD